MRQQRALVSAKLKMPVPRAHALSRSHLQQRIARMTQYKITVVQGAAGSGKSTLMAVYLTEHSEVDARWVSLDAGDNDTRAFWSYVLEALKPDLGEQATTMQQLLDVTLQQGDVDTVLAELVNRFQPDRDVCLILDDAHHLTDGQLVASLQFFLRYVSHRVHVVFLTRESLALPLSEWRMAGELLEIGHEDLKVSEREARKFLTSTLNLSLDDATLEFLTASSEGWLGGLQLLAVAVAQGGGSVDTAEAMNHAVVAYLSEQILDALAPEEQHFLVVTSILTYLHGDVCEAVTGRETAGDTLHHLLARNVLIVTVDDAAGLYRYHHLFHRFLQQRFGQLPLNVRRQYHLRAAQYYGKQIGFHSVDDATNETVRHYMEADAYDRALAVIGNVPGGSQRWRLLQKVPLPALKGQPDFIYQRLFSYMAEQRLDRCEPIIEYFRDSFDDPLANRLFALLGMLIGYGSFPLEIDGLTPDRLQRMPLGHETKAILYALVAMVLTMAEREREALTCLQEVDRIMPQVQNPYIRYYCWQFKAQLKEHMGDLAECEAIYTDMFRLIEEHPFLAPIAVTAHVGIVGILLKGGRLDDARRHLDEVKPRAMRGDAMTMNPELSIAYLYNALEYELFKGDRAAAREVMRQLPIDDVLSSPHYRATMLRYLMLLDMATEAHLARFHYDRIDHPTWQDDALQARLLVRDGETDAAVTLIDRRLAMLRKQQARLPLVDTLLLKAEMVSSPSPTGGISDSVVGGNGGSDGVGDSAIAGSSDSGGVRATSNSRDVLREAVYYSYKNRLLAPFLLADASIVPGIRRLRQDPSAELRDGEVAFLDELLARRDAQGTAAETADRGASAGVGDVEPVPATSLLTARETEVLHVLAEGVTNKQIAERLFISLATVKSHIVSIYAKLEVSNRLEAVEKARRLSLIR